MKLFDKFKNIFTEEVEESPIKKEVRQVEIKGPKDLTTETPVEEKKEEKFVFPVFDDKDFEELKPRQEPIKEPVRKDLYGIKKEPKFEPKVVQKFTLSPVISPVYGVLNKNYNRDDVVDKKETQKVTREVYKTRKVTLEDIRKKAYGTLEDDIELSLFESKSNISSSDVLEDMNPIEVMDKIIVNKVEEYSLDSTNDITIGELEKRAVDFKDDSIDMNKDDLFNLIDSMYEKDDDNNGSL